MKKPSNITVNCVLGILYVAIASTVILFFFIPWLVLVRLNWYFTNIIPSFLFLYLGGILALWMMFEFTRIMKSVKAEKPFSPRNVQSLWHISISAGACAADMAFMLLFLHSIALFICMTIFIFGCLSAAVLANVFYQAIHYKQENDLTI